ncbi:MAG: hypothetical protein KGR26_12870 [Cyanobacteria bacterium REEB65]|nr:hypothetical protein [Cyanobacteria bacterium REEB65]
MASSSTAWRRAPMVGVLIGLMLLITLWGAVTTWRDYLHVHQPGMREAQAAIVKRYVGHGRSNAFRVAYAFRVRNPSGGLATFSNRRAVGLSLFRELANSPVVAIRYLPSDPRISEIEGNDHELVNASILSGASLLLAIALAAFLINPRVLLTPISLRARLATKKP